MPLLHTDAITLRRRRSKEADSLAVLFTRERGKITVSTKSVRKSTSRYAGVTQPFHQLHTVLYAKTHDQEIWTLTQASLVHPFHSLQQDMERLAYASCLAEWTELLSGEFESNEAVWNLLCQAFQRWNTAPARVEDLFFYQWKLLRIGGLQPQIEECIKTGVTSSEDWQYSPEDGGLIGGASPLNGVSAGAVQALRTIARSQTPPPIRLTEPQQQQIQLMLRQHLEYHTGCQSRASLFLDKMRRFPGTKEDQPRKENP